ncbi:MAG: cell division protein ZapE [Alphaproteobacteria bacterium]|nr:cell division protein ZapE [Alphaproteobacteria bacterium]
MQLDTQQLLVKQELEQLRQSFNHGFIKKILRKTKPVKSLYIHGSTGRGKTMLMRNFFESLPNTAKTYFHFNSFMRAIHEALRDIRMGKEKYKDELIEAVKRVVGQAKLLCLDEFQVNDIADAMLLSRIFSFLFSQEVVVIFTSNSPPLELYQNGLQREIFLEFVREILLENCQVLYLDSPTDYRAKFKAGLTKRYFISSKKNREEIKRIIENLTEEKRLRSKMLKVWGRELKIKKTYKKIAVVGFDELCVQPLCASDYQAICKNFDLIFLLKLPQLKDEDVNEMRRFMLFIDEVYENKVALIILAKTPIKKICSAKIFKRTASRLREIRSDEYWTKTCKNN